MAWGTAASPGATTIVGGSIGNGDFNAGGNPPTATQTFAETSNWFNAGGVETANFAFTNQLGGSSDPSSVVRGGFPANNRNIVNDTSYTINAADEVFSLSYDFGASGAAANWNGDETMTLFLFTTAVPVDGNIGNADLTEIASDVYSIDRANDGQWSSHTSPAFFTSGAGDIGKTVHLGMRFNQGSAPNVFGRIDIVDLSVAPVPEPSAVILLCLGFLGLMARRKRS